MKTLQRVCKDYLHNLISLKNIYNMIKVTGNNDLDIDLKTEALQELSKQPTEILERLVELSKIKKAIVYLSTEKGFATIKTVLGK